MARRKRTSDRPEERGSERKPTHYLKMKPSDYNSSGWSTVGAAWEKESGNVSIRLNRGVILDWHDLSVDDPEFTLVLVPADWPTT